MQSEERKKMEQQVDMIQCLKCGKVREKFLVGCPKCGAIENRSIDPEQKSYYEITLQTIQNGKGFYKKELTDEQRTWFTERIPTGQSWQFYAGVVLVNNLNTVWLVDLTRNGLLDRDKWEEPICCGNSRVYFIMSFMTQEKQQKFCDMLNAFNHERIRDDKERDKANMERENVDPSNRSDAESVSDLDS